MFRVIEGGNQGLSNKSLANLTEVSCASTQPKFDIDQIILDVESAHKDAIFTNHHHYVHNPDGKSHLTVFLKNIGEDKFGLLFNIIREELDFVGLRLRKETDPEEEGTVAMRRFSKSWVLYFEPKQSTTGITVWLSLGRALKSRMARYA